MLPDDAVRADLPRGPWGADKADYRIANLRAHERYLTTLLAGYEGPYRRGWEDELTRVRATIAQLSGARAPGAPPPTFPSRSDRAAFGMEHDSPRN